jgi:predicted ATPase
MNAPLNPYATALDGLELPDPIAAFFAFCREREQIRHLREQGQPAPWSADPIFQRGRFLNVFREDDRGSKAIFRFAEHLKDDLPRLLQALFFARWCNSQSTLDALDPKLLAEPVRLRSTLESLPNQPWCNVTAYPVEPVTYQGKLYSRFDTATTLFSAISMELTQAVVDAEGDVVRATEAVNSMFAMSNDFPIFMAVIDVAWFRPDVVDPGSHVPTGIGAVAFLDRLQQHLKLDSHEQTCDAMMALQKERWPEAKRPFQPIDIEYLSCECRKYFSYLNGTKQFEGKNLFHAGEDAQLVFDLDEDSAADAPIQTKIHVIAGGPCSGKTTVLKALQEAGHRIEFETAEIALQEGIAAGHSAAELRADPIHWQQQMLRKDYQLFNELPVDELVFTDTSFLETLVFGTRAGLAIGPKLQRWLRSKRYKAVFFLAPLEDYEQSDVRLESHHIATQISKQVQASYRHFGYDVIIVPAAPVAERVAFILSRIEAG